jgi:hypothetical protein
MKVYSGSRPSNVSLTSSLDEGGWLTPRPGRFTSDNDDNNNNTDAHLWQSLLYFYSFVYNLIDDGLVEAKTCRRDSMNGKWLFVIDCASPLIKYRIVF